MKHKLRYLALVTALALAPVAIAEPQDKNSAPLDIPKDLKPYFVAFLVKGDNYTAEQTPEASDLLRKHLSYIRSQLEKKVYVVAGPFTDDGRIAGMCIVSAKSLEEATGIVNADPVVKAGRFKIEIHPAMFAEIESTARFQ